MPTFTRLVVGCVVAVSAPALAVPLLSTRPVPSAIAGPADPHVAAIFYNPAALSYLRGIRFFADGGARVNAGSLHLDDNSGSSSYGWANLDSFVGLSWDLATESLTLGLAVDTPFTDFSSFTPKTSARFAERAMSFATLEETLAGAWQVARQFAIGASLIVDENWLAYDWSRDLAPAGGSASVSQPNQLCGGAACGYRNPLAEQQIHLQGYATGIGFSVGTIIRPVDRLWIGLSYSSHQAGRDLILGDSHRARVSPAPGQGSVCGGGPCAGDDRVVTLLPEMVQVGARIGATLRLEVEAQFRFVHYGARTSMDVSMQGGSLALSRVAPQFLLDRGLQNTYMIEVSTRHLVTPDLRLSPSLLFESAAIAPDAVSAAAIEGNKLDAALTVEWRAWHNATTAFFLGAHLGATVHLLAHQRSRYDAVAETACVDAGYSLAACGAVNAGDALPSAAGDYHLIVVSAGASVGVVYQP